MTRAFVRSELQELGLDYHTIVPGSEKEAGRALIVDLEGAVSRDTVVSAGKAMDARSVSAVRGKGAFIGEDEREAASALFGGLVDEYERTAHRTRTPRLRGPDLRERFGLSRYPSGPTDAAEEAILKAAAASQEADEAVAAAERFIRARRQLEDVTRVTRAELSFATDGPPGIPYRGGVPAAEGLIPRGRTARRSAGVISCESPRRESPKMRRARELSGRL